MSRDRSESDDRTGRPLPPRLDPRAGRPPRNAAGHQSGPPSPSRTGGTRAAITLRVVAGALSLVLLCTTGWGWYLGRVADASVHRTDAIPTDGNDDTSGNGAAMNLLLVGSDSRATLTDAEKAALHTGDDSGLNTDTMILVHVPADGSKASFVSFPRDSYVQIPGHGWDKLNAAYAYGYTAAGRNAAEEAKQTAGQQLLVRTISQLTGLQIDHYAEVDLLGFFKISNVIGGVEVNLCAPVKDKYSAVDLPAGVQTISGEQALAFVRQRHGLKRGDFDRIVRQQTFIAGMIRKILSDNVLFDLGKQRQLVQAAAGSLTVDQGLDLFQLAGQMQSVTAGSISFQTIPYAGDDEDDQGRYILRLQDTQTLHTFFANLSADQRQSAAPTQSTAPQTVAPSQVSVAVYNGSGVRGLAATAASALQQQGYTITSTGNADNAEYTATEIRYAAGDEALAATLAATIPGVKTAQADEATKGTVQLVLGSDFQGIGQAVKAPATTPPVQGETARTAADTSCIN